MRKFVLAAAAAVVVAAPSYAATAYNSAPADGWFFGSGNNYSPANTAVLTTDARDQLYLRWHQRLVVAPASVGNVYSFALGTSPLSFDWGIDGAFTSATLTVLNVATGQFASYNALDPLGFGFSFNDNAIGLGSTQNSAHLGFSFLSGAAFDANLDNTYRLTLDVNGLAGGPQSLSVDARLGTGTPVPEAATWAMMVGGFAMVGAGMRRRRTSVRFA